MPHFRTGMRIDSKDRNRFDPVTAADRDAERAIRDAIEAKFPDHGIVGEELGSVRRDAEMVWVIDPIDGTRSFVAGVPVWGVLIGLLNKGKPALGLMAQPFTGERFTGDGKAAWYRGPDGSRALKTRPCPRIDEAFLFTTSPHLFGEADKAAYGRVEGRVRLARYGTDCYAYCMVAAGFVDAVVEADLEPHDVLPLIPIIEGAGGLVTDWEGNPPLGGGRVVATGDPRLHDRILGILAG
jgi:myo-inositol-1(or 4)-monophosphatase